ncbi:MAG: hypothetical protein EBR51_09800, partial [Gammaproteobacteria bacterium]|nr:hypothetical protein [Gammaproteobacteria bacterium]
DIGPFGNKTLRTPHLDRFAAEGMRFTSFYATPVCSMSRASGAVKPGEASMTMPNSATVSTSKYDVKYAVYRVVPGIVDGPRNRLACGYCISERSTRP